MNDVEPRTSTTTQDTEALVFSLRRTLYPRSAFRTAGLVILGSFLIFFLRPQHSIPALGAAKLALMWSLLALLCWLPRYNRDWTKPTAAMLFFLLIEAAIGLIGKAYDPFVRNDFWHFHTWRDLAQQFFCLCFPIVVFFSYGRQIRRLVAVSIFVGAYLATYSLLHSGRGPGGFLGDENDICLTILLFLPLPMLLLPTARGLGLRFLYISSILVMLAGVVATQSRGGFVGLIALFGYFLLKSNAKAIALLLALLISVTAVFLVPEQYWNEMQTITDTDTGTAQKRRDLWKIAARVWLDKRHIVKGVGMNNTPFWLADFEPRENRLPTGKSAAGRAVHSFYLQLAADLGLIGICLISFIFIKCFLNNMCIAREATFFRRGVKLLWRHFISHRKHIERGQKRATVDVFESLGLVQQELTFLIALSTALNTAWAGVLVAALFISVLYYPPVWFLTAFSAATYVYWRRLRAVLEPLTTHLESTIETTKEPP